MPKTKVVPDDRQREMFENLPTRPPERKFKRLDSGVWTKNKAQLVGRYLFYFVQITHHGTYIDGFAGSQVPSRPSSWASKLVLRNRLLGTFYFFDRSRKQADRLKKLRTEARVGDAKRKIRVQCGDFNRLIRELLKNRPIRPTQATFCLLDQRAFECHWRTVKALAAYKGGGHNKIELFYLLAVGWIHRSVAGIKSDIKKATGWWGASDWRKVLEMTQEQVRDEFVERFKRLGYKYVDPWPIYSNPKSRRIMYYMIHASDHPEAYRLMQRAYHNVVRPKETVRQLVLKCCDPALSM